MNTNNRRTQQKAQTRELLIAAGMQLFADSGYAETSAAQIVAAANVTRGALYHHFPEGKLGLFEAIVAHLLKTKTEGIAAALEPASSPEEHVHIALNTYFDYANEPAYLRIVLQEARAVLGWDRWRALAEKYSITFISGDLSEMIHRGDIEPTSLEALTAVIYGSACEAALMMSESDDPEGVRTGAIKLISALAKVMTAKAAN